MFFRIKSDEEQKKLLEAGRITSNILSKLIKMVKPGTSMLELDTFAYDEVIKANCIPAFKNYHGFQGTICSSINEELVHGVPSEKVVKNGDIVTIDLGVNCDGWFGDSAITLLVGDVKDRTVDLVKRTQESLYAGIKNAVVGNRLGHVAEAIYSCRGPYEVVTEFGGHGIGDVLHDEPFVYNKGSINSGVHLRHGMAIAIEPMLVDGSPKHKTDKDDKWTVTVDHMCAHFEHTMIITDDGPVVTTKREDEVI